MFFAHSYPYTYSDLQVNQSRLSKEANKVVILFHLFQDYLMAIQKNPVKSQFCKLRLLCRSLAGNNVYYLTVTAPTNDNENV